MRNARCSFDIRVTKKESAFVMTDLWAIHEMFYYHNFVEDTTSILFLSFSLFNFNPNLVYHFPLKDLYTYQ